jgi:microcystin-dependent protein
MPSTYTTNLGIELPADGELDGIWGDVVNDNMSILDRAINGSVALTLTGTTSTLTTSDGTLNNGQYKLLVLGGSPSGTHTITIAPNDAQKIYFVVNGTAQSVVLTQGSGGNVTVPAGRSALVYADGGGASAAVADFSANLVPVLSNAGVTASTAELNILDGVTATTAEINILDGVTATADELNILDGVTATTAEINILDGVTADTAELNILDGVTSTTAELNILDGVTSTTAELNILDGVTATTAELNILDGVTATTAELNFVDGVTSAIQTQLDAKAASSAGVPSGAVAHFAMDTAPTGWLKANGAAVSRSTYAILFSAIGTTFGVGDGSTTFNLPDLRGEFPRGWDDGRGIDSGRAFGSAQADELKSHTHTFTYALSNNTVVTNVGSGATSSLTTKTTNATGGTETRPRNIALLACIKF